MSNKSFRLLWLKLQREDNRHFYFTFPIPFYVFQELLDCFLDLLTLACLFVPNNPNSNLSSSFTVYTVKELVQITMKLLDSITEGEPYDLVDVTADKVRVSIKIRWNLNTVGKVERKYNERKDATLWFFQPVKLVSHIYVVAVPQTGLRYAMGVKMRKIILKYLSIILLIYLLSMVIDTIYISDTPALLIMGLVLLIVNLLLKPLLLLITLPFSILTLGLFTFIVNSCTIMAADHFVPGINMGGFLNSLLAAFIIVILHNLLRDANKPSSRH